MARIHALTPREQYDLFLRWGFVNGGSAQGGHVKMWHPDRNGHVTITAPGRPKRAKAHVISLKQGAQMMGVGVREFMAGPPKPEKIEILTDAGWEATAETSALLPALPDPVGGEVSEAAPAVDDVQPEEEQMTRIPGTAPERNGKWARYTEALEAWGPGDVVSISDMVKYLKLDDIPENRVSVGAFLGQRARAGVLERRKRGLYRIPWAEQPGERPVENEPEVVPPPDKAPGETPSAASLPDLYEVVRNLDGGRVLLQGADGGLFVGRIQRLAIDL